jgi:hypothetical protein
LQSRYSIADKTGQFMLQIVRKLAENFITPLTLFLSLCNQFAYIKIQGQQFFVGQCSSLLPAGKYSKF